MSTSANTANPPVNTNPPANPGTTATIDLKCDASHEFEGTIEKLIDYENKNNNNNKIHDNLEKVLQTNYNEFINTLKENNPYIDTSLSDLASTKPKSAEFPNKNKFKKCIEIWETEYKQLLSLLKTKKYNNREEFIKGYNFNTKPVPELSKTLKIVYSNDLVIPTDLDDTVDDSQGQYVFGRMIPLISYIDAEKRGEKYKTLNTDFWDDTLHINDAFTECACEHLKEFNYTKNPTTDKIDKFPLRIVLLKGESFSDKNYGNRVIARELCQLLYNYKILKPGFELNIYQCTDPNYKHIFFLADSSRDTYIDITRFKKCDLKYNNDFPSELTYDKRKYLKYKQKYLNAINKN